METTDYASYDLALKLKACGFDEPCEAFYEHINGKMYFSVDGSEDWNSGVDYSAPTEQTEVYKIQNATASELRDLANHGISVGDEIKRRIKERDEKPNVGSIKIPVEVDLKDSYWDAYAADLAHDLAVQMVKGNRNNYDKIGEMAVRIAKSVVKNLRK